MKKYSPPSHTAEYNLNQTIVRYFNKGRAFRSHIEKKKTKCDYKHFQRNLKKEKIRKIEEKVNEIISLNLNVNEYFILCKEAEKRFNSDKLPENAGEEIRIVTIGNYNACPCIGEHIKRTSEIGKFKMISSNFEN